MGRGGGGEEGEEEGIMYLMNSSFILLIDRYGNYIPVGTISYIDATFRKRHLLR